MSASKNNPNEDLKAARVPVTPEMLSQGLDPDTLARLEDMLDLKALARIIIEAADVAASSFIPSF